MYLGSYTTVDIVLDEMPEDYDACEVYLTQRNVQYIKGDDELTIAQNDDGTYLISFILTPEETNQFFPGDCQVQVRVGNTDTGEVFFSDLMRFPWDSTVVTDG